MVGEGAAEGMGKNGSVRGHGKGAVPRKRDDGVRPTTLWGATQRGAAHKRRRYDVKRPTSAPFFPPDRRCAFPYHSPQVQKHSKLHLTTPFRPTPGAKSPQNAPDNPFQTNPRCKNTSFCTRRPLQDPPHVQNRPKLHLGWRPRAIGGANNASRG